MANRSRNRGAGPLPGPAVLQEVASQAAAEAGTWVERLARFGYAAKGVVYILVGGLAAYGAVTAGRGARGSRGALSTLLGEPLGALLLGVVGVGLLGYVLWRFVQAVTDPDRHGSDAKGLGLRAFFVANGVVYLSLAVAVLAMAFGDGGGGGDDGYGAWVARGMRQPMGRWLVGAAGATVVGVGLYQFVRAWTAKFKKRLERYRMSATEERWATRIGRFGFAARGVTFVVIGGFVISAALNADPGAAGGLEEVFSFLEGQPFGTWLLALVAVGLMAYGVFQLVMARYRRIGVG